MEATKVVYSWNFLLSTGFSFTKSSFFIILTIFSLSDHSSIIVICNFTMSIPKGKTQLPPNLRNWCKPINSRHCRYTSFSNFILSTMLTAQHLISQRCVGSIWHHIAHSFYYFVTFIHVSCAALDRYAPHWFHTHHIGSSLRCIGS